MEVSVRSKLVNQQRMKKSITRETTGFFSDDEFEVAEILLKLPQLITQEKQDCVFPFSWGVKKKRSGIDLSPSPPRHPPSPRPLTPLLPDSCNGCKSSIKVESNSPATPLSSNSPATPLSFSPSESESKPGVVLRRKKMTKQDMLEVIESLTENIKILKQEIPKARAHYETLKHTNSMLKQMERKLISSEKPEDPNLNSSPEPITGPALEEFPSQASAEEEEEEEGSFRVLEQEKAEVGPSVSYSSKEPNELKEQYNVMLSGIGLGIAKQLGTIGLSNLNLSMESSFSIDYLRLYDLHKAAIAAEARKKRIEINRKKSSMGSIKPRCR
ncbi:uncharacterized protein LOC122074757 [Macadamia integrifolia]|uniref:uncharacterized protein LOC122074757 n=1 Tax=Macadamia integrifolia TaxID=60698 RepID=UPI001C4F02FD|nr:uncharacterized protein LOC122074757 [Macadamia integrifolia]